jgi:hypothetical protein
MPVHSAKTLVGIVDVELDRHGRGQAHADGEGRARQGDSIVGNGQDLTSLHDLH